jgi:plasmid rolling circle replication initiator protein Rep
MQLNNNKQSSKNQMEILKDTDKKGKQRPWRENKLKTLALAESYKRLGMKKSYRVSECGTYLEYKRYLEDNSLKLHRANFCKVRLCPMCSWRRSKKIYGQVSKVMDKALEDKEYRFLFLTLTCRNVEGEELSETLDDLFQAFKLLTKRKAFKNAVKGWFRALEITHNIDKDSESYDTYHPHFHMILMVNKSYFDKPEIYISHEKWTSLWKDCLGVEYTPIVHVTAFKADTKSQTSKSVAEVATYTVKDNDYLIADNEGLTDSAVWILDTALAGRRLVAFGGELRKIHKALNLDDAVDGDLVHTDDEEIREDLKYVIEIYHWNIGYNQGQYVKWGVKYYDDEC